MWTERLKELKEERITIDNDDLLELVKSAKGYCYWCGKRHQKDYHIDHYIPLSKGGSNTIENLVVACKSCNLKKHAKEPIAFANSIGKLL